MTSGNPRLSSCSYRDGRAFARSLTSADEVTVRPAVERHLRPIARGWFWDRWLAAYYRDRVMVEVTVERIVHFCDGGAASSLAVLGRPLGDGVVAVQRHPVGPPSSRSATLVRRVVRQQHRLVGALDAEGYPTIVPISEVDGDGASIAFTASAARLLPAGGRRAVLIGHSYRPHLVGLETRQVFGWMDGAGARRSFIASREAAAACGCQRASRSFCWSTASWPAGACVARIRSPTISHDHAEFCMIMR